jgi:hypothetical protein
MNVGMCRMLSIPSKCRDCCSLKSQGSLVYLSTEKLDGEMVAGIYLRIEDLMLLKTNEELSNMSVALDNQN